MVTVFSKKKKRSIKLIAASIIFWLSIIILIVRKFAFDK